MSNIYYKLTLEHCIEEDGKTENVEPPVVSLLYNEEDEKDIPDVLEAFEDMVENMREFLEDMKKDDEDTD